MAENRVATMIVGVGGIGGRGGDKVGGMLSAKEKAYVSVVAIDTNREDLMKLDNVVKVSIGDDRKIQELLLQYPEYVDRFPMEKHILSRSTRDGAGQIPAISALALAVAAKGDYNPLSAIDHEIERILAHNPDVDTEKLNVIIIGSITGGTCAGTFLQIAFYIREYVLKHRGSVSVFVRGMFVGPDITANEQDSVINREAVMVNAFSSIKGLNAFNLTQMKEYDNENLEMDFYVKRDNEELRHIIEEKLIAEGKTPGIKVTSKDFNKKVDELASDGANIPYDVIYMIEGSSKSGGIGNVSITTVENLIAKMVYTMQFTPIRGVDAGIQDNGTMLDMTCSHMNRYSGIGICTIRYPFEQLKEYVTLKWIQHTVSDEWLLLDSAYEAEKRDAESRRKSDPSVELPELSEVYTRKFKEECKGGAGTRLSHLKKEAFLPTKNNSEIPKSRADVFVENIDAEITRILADPEVKAAEEQCRINQNYLKDKKKVNKEVLEGYENLSDYQTVMYNHVEKRQYEVANKVFPDSGASLKMHLSQPGNVYDLLAKVHPITGRYLCYEIIHRLKEKIRTTEREMVSPSALSAYLDNDFDNKEPDIQDANQAIQIAMQQRILFIPTGGKKITSIANSFVKMSANQVKLIKKYGEMKIRLTTYRNLLRRFEQLAEDYKIFFDSIRRQIDKNAVRTEILEKSFDENPMSEIIVYGSRNAFRKTYEDFRRTVNMEELPEAIMTRIFWGLYDQSCIALGIMDDGMLDEEIHKREEEQARQKIAELFTTAVVEHIRNMVETRSDGSINITIKEAIARQMKMETGMQDNSKEFEASRVAYTKELIRKGMKMADPMLAVKNEHDIMENVYLAIHEDSGEMSAGEVDRAFTATTLVPSGIPETDGHKPHLLMEKSFSRYEMICMKAKHKYMIENLVRYAPDSQYAKLYHARIANLDQEISVKGPNAYKTVVTPHIYSNWHQEGVIPSLTAEERKNSERRIRRAFIYAMGIDLFVREETEGFGSIKRWKVWNQLGSTSLVKKDDMVIENGYLDLFNALKFNKGLVEYILAAATVSRKYMKDNYDTGKMELDDVLEFDLIRDLVQPEPEEDDENLFDIFLNMKKVGCMSEQRWDELFDGLKDTLADYFRFMFPSNINRVNAMYLKTLDLLYAHSTTGKKADLGIPFDSLDEALVKKVNVLKQSENRILH